MFFVLTISLYFPKWAKINNKSFFTSHIYFYASDSEGVCNRFDKWSNVVCKFSTCSVSSRPSSSVSNFNRLDKSELGPAEYQTDIENTQRVLRHDLLYLFLFNFLKSVILIFLVFWDFILSCKHIFKNIYQQRKKNFKSIKWNK